MTPAADEAVPVGAFVMLRPTRESAEITLEPLVATAAVKALVEQTVAVSLFDRAWHGGAHRRFVAALAQRRCRSTACAIPMTTSAWETLPERWRGFRHPRIPPARRSRCPVWLGGRHCPCTLHSGGDAGIQYRGGRLVVGSREVQVPLKLAAYRRYPPRPRRGCGPSTRRSTA